MTDMTLFTDSLKGLRSRGLYRGLRRVTGSQGRHIVLDGKKVLNFCSNNYLGLADDQRLKDAAIECLSAQGVGAGASRLVCGNMQAHEMLERRIAELKGAKKCLVFSCGYMANVGIISSLCSRGDLILCDKLNHASIIDGILLSGASYRRYPHLDMETLENLLCQARRDESEARFFKKVLIVTDSVFSMDGDIAPLDKIVDIASKYKAMVMVDEAHALGVFGERGQGLVQHFGLEDKIDIQMGTLSKSVGAFGAYCCGSKELISFLINKARSFIYTTGMPPAVAAAALKGMEIIEQEGVLRKRLWRNTYYLKEALAKEGFDIMNSQSPIIPILTKENHLALEASRRLLEEGIFVQAIRPPTVPPHTARLRLTVMATHTKEDLDMVLNKLKKIGKELCLI